MEKAVYLETYRLESSYWWHISKRKLVQQAIKNLVGSSKNLHILDAGCGTGILMSELQPDYPLIYGLDKSILARKFCHKRGLYSVHPGNLEKKLLFENNTFDAIICLDVIEHLDNDFSALGEFRRILKPNGVLFISVPAYQFLWTKHDDMLWHKRRYRRTLLNNLIKSAGFKILKSTYFYSFLIPPAIILFKFKLMFNSGTSKSTVIPPKIINWLLLQICAFERLLIRYISLPTGISIFVVAQKREQ